MRLYPPEVVVGDREGFTPGKDIFNRAEIGLGLTNLVTVVSDPTVIALDAQWGAGKTVFLKMWAGELRKAGFPVVYFDAFANDFTDDAFTALAGEVIQLVEERHKAGTSEAEKFRAKAFGAGKVLLRSALRAGVKIATLSAIDTKDLEEVAKIASEEMSQLEDKFIGEMLTKHKEEKEIFAAFRSALSELPAMLSDNQDSLGGDRPLIFIIDELDRCRPVFALNLLERIKHFFAVPGVHFVLGAHLGQLQNSVVAAYGSGIDAKTYLEKFIHITVNLADGARYEYEKINAKFISYLREVYQFKPEDRDFVESCSDMILHVAEYRALSLRTIERIMSTIALILAFTVDGSLRLTPVIVTLAIMKTVDPAMYGMMRRNAVSYADVIKFLNLDPMSDGKFGWHIRWLRYALDPDMPQTEVDDLSQGVRNFSMRQRLDVVGILFRQVMDRLRPASG